MRRATYAIMGCDVERHGPARCWTRCALSHSSSRAAPYRARLGEAHPGMKEGSQPVRSSNRASTSESGGACQHGVRSGSVGAVIAERLNPTPASRSPVTACEAHLQRALHGDGRGSQAQGWRQRPLLIQHSLLRGQVLGHAYLHVSSPNGGILQPLILGGSTGCANL